MQIIRYSSYATLLFLLLLAGCVPAPTVRVDYSPPPPSLSNNPRFASAIALEQSGNYLAAATQFERLAAESEPPVQQQALLRAMEDYLAAGDIEYAYRLHSLIGTDGFPQLDFQKRVLMAEAALKRNQPEEAQQLLQQRPRGDVSADIQKRYYRTRSETYKLTGNLLESARAQSELDLLLNDPQQRVEVQKEIVRTLSTYTDSALRTLRPSPPGIFGGWMELARIIKVYPNDPQLGQQRLETWRERFSSHPAMPELLEGYFKRISTLYKAPSHVAVLLPQSGPYAKAGAALRRGLMAAYYKKKGGNRPELRFYDSSDSSGIWSTYQQAVAAGADMVIGPLSKESVAQLARSGYLDTPVLALNQVSGEVSPPRNLFQFALSPEDEARQVAERAWVDGHTTALALYPKSNWGTRVFDAFRRRWEQLGGTLLEAQTYDSAEHDFSAPIQAVLNVAESKQRYQTLQRLLGTDIEFEPRRRQDAGFIFLAAKSQLARQVRPQLQFHHAADLPVYTTSHAYSGVPSPKMDLDLEGIRFPDIPWLLVSGEEHQASTKELPKKLAAFGRLFAMGIDAYELLPHLSRLEVDSGETLDGKTGILYLDGLKQVRRQLVWAQMKRGKPKVIGYAPRLEQSRGGLFPAPSFLRQ
jgi:outer membrane PBP1 activator LpoA protein